MFTLKDLKKLTVSTPVSCMESIKVNGKMIEVSRYYVAVAQRFNLLCSIL